MASLQDSFGPVHKVSTTRVGRARGGKRDAYIHTTSSRYSRVKHNTHSKIEVLLERSFY